MKLNNKRFLYTKIWVFHFLLYPILFFNLFHKFIYIQKDDFLDSIFSPIVIYPLGVFDYFLCFPIIMIMIIIMKFTRIKLQFAYILSVFVPTLILVFYQVLAKSDVIWPQNNETNTIHIIILKFVCMFFVFITNWLIFRKDYKNIENESL